MAGRVEQLKNEFGQFCAYQGGCNQALAPMMQTLALHMGVNMETFLTLPMDSFAIPEHDVGPSLARIVEKEEEEESSSFQWIEME